MSDSSQRAASLHHISTVTEQLRRVHEAQDAYYRELAILALLDPAYAAQSAQMSAHTLLSWGQGRRPRTDRPPPI